MILVFCKHLFTKANANPIQAKLTTRLLHRKVTEELKIKIDSLWYRLTVLRPSGQGGKQYGRIVSSLYIFILYHTQQEGGGAATEGGGGLSCLNTKPDTNDQPYLTILYQSGFSNKFF
jgi:hypothetical protein